MRLCYWRQLKVQRNFLRGFFAVLFVLVAAVLQIDLASAGSLEGNCIPVSERSHAWECSADSFLQKCNQPRSDGLDPIWQIVDNEAKAKLLLTRQYKESENLHQFLQWLSCQGFSIGGSGQHPGLEEGGIVVDASYLLSRVTPFPPPWYRPVKPYGGTFEIFFDRFGAITKIDHGYNTL